MRQLSAASATAEPAIKLVARPTDIAIRVILCTMLYPHGSFWCQRRSLRFQVKHFSLGLHYRTFCQSMCRPESTLVSCRA